MKTGYIYSLICPIDKKCRYIGKTTQSLNKRRYKHLYEAEKWDSKKNSWLKKLKKLNLLYDVIINLIETCNINSINKREIHWIAEYKKRGFKLTNMTEGGDCGSLGYKHSEKAKKLISEKAKLPRKKMSKEGRYNISQTLFGNTRSKGHKVSDEAKKIISEKGKGKISWNAQSIIQLDKKNNFIKEWRSAHFAAKTLNLSQGNIWSAINGKRKSCGGYIWKLK